MRLRLIYAAGPLVVLAAAAALGGVVMVLWNFVAPALLAGSRTIDYPHALGLLVLCRILFGGFRGRGGWRGRRRWDKWGSMTPEERERFLSSRSGRRSRWSET